MKYKFSLKILFGSGLLFCVVVFIVFRSVGFMSNDVLIKNHSGMQIKTVQIGVNDSNRIIGPIKTGEAGRISFGFPKQECEIEINIEFEDSTKLSTSVGYLSTVDFNTLHEITITENGVIYDPARRRRFFSAM